MKPARPALTSIAMMVLLSGCDVVDRGGVERLSDEPAVSGEERVPFITNGSFDQGHPTVGILQCGSAGCSATLIGPRTVLTAGHCVPSSPCTFKLAGQAFASAQITRHPAYGGGNKNDLAVIRLQTAVTGVTPSPLNSAAPFVGESITLVGFGVTSEGGTGFGTKRMATNTVSGVSATTFSFRGTSNVCNGDSGGPTFVQAGDVEAAAGVHSTKSGACGVGGTDMRVDAFRSWIIATAAGDVVDGGAPPAEPPPTSPPPTSPPSTPPSTPPSGAASEGQSCASAACASGLACVGVYSGSSGALIGKYCMTRCTTPGADAACNGGEVCTNSRSAGPVCFDASRPSSGYTDPAGSTSPPPSTPPAPPPTQPPAGGACGSADESAVFTLLNQQRATQGLSALACDLKASAVARAYSQDMCDRNYFSHYSPEGLAPWDRLRAGGVSFTGAGENIAMGYPTPAAVHAGWMASAGHRQNMLTPSWLRVGIGLVRCHGGTPYWTEDFMR